MDNRDEPLVVTHLFSPAAIFGLLAVTLVCSLRAVMKDGDTYTHLAAGLWMIDHRTVLDVDPFSATFAGAPWVAHEWLSEVLLALAYRAGGLSGPMLLTAVATGITVVNLARHIESWNGRRATLLLTAAGFICIMPSILSRPHVLALPLLELWVAELLQAREDGRQPSWGMLPLMSLWANLHGTFAFGLMLAACFAVAATLTSKERWRTTVRWWIFVCMAIGAATLNPRGLEGFLFPLRLLQMQSLSYITEWQPVDFSDGPNLAAVLLALVALLATGRVRVDLFRSVVLVSVVYLALAHVRHCVLIGIVGPLFLAKPVGEAFARVGPARARPLGIAFCWMGLAIVGLIRLMIPFPILNSTGTPVAALAHLPREVLAVPMLNSVQFGGYLSFVGLHPFVDGRAELFGDRFLAECRNLPEANLAHLAEQMDHYGIGWALLTIDDPLVARFAVLPGWRQHFTDNIAVVFVRT